MRSTRGARSALSDWIAMERHVRAGSRLRPQWYQALREAQASRRALLEARELRELGLYRRRVPRAVLDRHRLQDRQLRARGRLSVSRAAGQRVTRSWLWTSWTPGTSSAISS